MQDYPDATEGAEIMADAYAANATSEEMISIISSLKRSQPATFTNAEAVEAFIARITLHLRSRGADLAKLKAS